MPAAWVGAAAAAVSAGTAVYNATQSGDNAGTSASQGASIANNPYASQLQGAIGNYQNQDPLYYMRGLMGGQINTAPGYGFNLAQGTRSMNAANAAAGQTASGGALTRAQQFGQGLATQEFSNAWNRQAGLQGVQSGYLSDAAKLWLSASGMQPNFTNAATAAAAQNLGNQQTQLANLMGGIGGISRSLGNLYGSGATASDPYSYGNIDYSAASTGALGGSANSVAFPSYTNTFGADTSSLYGAGGLFSQATGG